MGRDTKMFYGSRGEVLVFSLFASIGCCPVTSMCSSKTFYNNHGERRRERPGRSTAGAQGTFRTISRRWGSGEMEEGEGDKRLAHAPEVAEPWDRDVNGKVAET